MKKYLILLLISTIIPLLTIIPLRAQIINNAEITIYKDGVAHVKISIGSDEITPYITLQLFSTNATNIVVYNEEKNLLDYDIEDNNIRIYSLGSTMITLEYDTNDLTYKQKALWIFRISTTFPISVTFPENAIIMGISSIPDSIVIEDKTIKMIFSPGYYEVNYEIPVIQPPAQQATIQPVIIMIAIIIIIVLIITILKFAKRRKIEEKLKDDEKKIIDYLKSKGNRALEAELREAFPEIPRTTMWRLLRRLEKQGIIKIKKVGIQNLVELIL
jgi:uncharacterized membrane protein